MKDVDETYEVVRQIPYVAEVIIDSGLTLEDAVSLLKEQPMEMLSSDSSHQSKVIIREGTLE